VGWASSIAYRLCRLGGRAVFFCTMNIRVIRRDLARRRGPYVLAITHLSHVEPFIVGSIVPRPIDFIARKEFYAYRAMAWPLAALRAIKVDRRGVPVRTIRTALDRLRAGRVVGIFPEGGVTRGAASACAGGPIRLGACLLACRANVPIVPVVVVGTHALTKIGPWLPARRGHLWLAFGEPIAPEANLGGTITERRMAYRSMGERLRGAFQGLYQEICATYGLSVAGEVGLTYAEADTASGGAGGSGERVPVRSEGAQRLGRGSFAGDEPVVS
jgi:1-acyl-sn-glycerol-3-phosphate acyltransferase